MPKVYKAKDILRFFEQQGFQKVSQKGSHCKLKNSLGIMIIIPLHSKDIPYGTFRAIVDQSGFDIKYVVQSLGK